MEADVETVSGKGTYLFALPIVADANNRYFAVLYHLNDGGNSSPIAWTHAINLVHYDQGALQILALVQTERTTFQQPNSAFVSHIACVELTDQKVVLSS